MGRLDDKVVIVTGASRGIGKDIAILFAAEGGKVICAARTVEGGHASAGGVAEYDDPGDTGCGRRGDCGGGEYIAA